MKIIPTFETFLHESRKSPSEDACTIHAILSTGQDKTQNFIDDNNINSEKIVDYLKQNLNSPKKYGIRDLIQDPKSNERLLKQFTNESVNENSNNAMIAVVNQRGNDYVVTGLTNQTLSRRSFYNGSHLVGFSCDLIVIKDNNEVTSYDPMFNKINTLYLGASDEVRGVVGPNILVYRKSENMLITYDRNFRKVSSFVVSR